MPRDGTPAGERYVADGERVFCDLKDVTLPLEKLPGNGAETIADGGGEGLEESITSGWS